MQFRRPVLFNPRPMRAGDSRELVAQIFVYQAPQQAPLAVI
jgi:hypothetical protein